jgi:hypothetical protein
MSDNNDDASATNIGAAAAANAGHYIFLTFSISDLARVSSTVV